MFATMTGVDQDEEIGSHIFRSFDTNKDELISFEELMCNFSVTGRGSTKEKLEWTFNMYDVDNDGTVTVE